MTIPKRIPNHSIPMKSLMSHCAHLPTILGYSKTLTHSDAPFLRARTNRPLPHYKPSPLLQATPTPPPPADDTAPLSFRAVSDYHQEGDWLWWWLMEILAHFLPTRFWQIFQDHIGLRNVSSLLGQKHHSFVLIPRKYTDQYRLNFSRFWSISSNCTKKWLLLRKDDIPKCVRTDEVIDRSNTKSKIWRKSIF